MILNIFHNEFHFFHYLCDATIHHACWDADLLETDTRSIEEQMASLRLYSKSYNCPTMASVILFGKDPKYFMPGCYVQYVRFGGLTKAGKILNEKEFKGSLAVMLPRLESFVADAIVTQRPEEVSLLREKTVSNYPHAALRELLMNACMHRDYQSNTPIRLYQFDDRIEIMNAGGLYGEARPENFPFVNAYRNPIVAEGMKVMKYVNMFNRGVSRVQEYLHANGSLPAQFNVDKLTVFEVIVTDATASVLTQVSDELRTNLAKLSKKQSELIKSLIINMEEGLLASKELQESVNSARTPHELRMNSARFFMKNVLKPAIELNIIRPLYPDTPHHPRQKYRLTETGIAMKKLLLTEKNNEQK
jgi:ATP-dependent DNA helicase RecG